ncbi:MAG: leucine-rich repeat domain-containing protein, partial [Ureaplasma sp.]|nr:leucine-rich repeat domain-containing protein [Ureaplasma sp.]
IQDLIDENQVNSNNISSYLSSQIYDLVKNVDTIGNGSLEQYITEPTLSSNSIKISLKSDVGRYKFKTSSLTNILITSNTISLNSITLYTPPTPSPVNWFTWNDRIITGLSNLGQNATKIVFPSITNGINSNAFSNNKNITSFDFSYSNVTFIGNSSFSNTQISKINLPNSLTSIGTSAFSNCVNLDQIIIPDTVTSIGTSAFSNCKSLTTIQLPKNLQYISESTFSNSGLSSIELPDSIESFGAMAFYACNNLKYIKLPKSLTTLNPSSSGNYFGYCRALETVVVNEGLTTIGYAMFNRCTSLKKINIPDSVTTIGDWAFSGCSKLEEITLPNSINTFGKHIFALDTTSEFQDLPITNLIVYVNSAQVKEKLSKVFSGTIINLG